MISYIIYRGLDDDDREDAFYSFTNTQTLFYISLHMVFGYIYKLYLKEYEFLMRHFIVTFTPEIVCKVDASGSQNGISAFKIRLVR